MDIFEILENLCDSKSGEVKSGDIKGNVEANLNRIWELSENPESKKDKEFYNDFKRLRVRYGTGRADSKVIGKDPANRNIYECHYRSGMMTDIGDIEESEWERMALQVIEKHGEMLLFECLHEYVKSWGWQWPKKNSPKLYALELHMSRIFENPEWKRYEDFKKIMASNGIAT